jgi:hypothetical protein
MFAAVTTVPIRPDRVEEARHFAREVMLPFARRQPGFLGCLELLDPATGQTLSIMLYATEAEARGLDTGGEAYQGMVAGARALVAGTFVRAVYEVVLHE